MSTARLLQLHVNGAPCQCEAGATLERLLVQQQLAGQRVAVERNGEIVPRSQYAATPLADGDRIEIVRAIGGG